LQKYIQEKLGQLGQNSFSIFGVDTKWGNESNDAWK
jgi:hypothetical protein